MQERIKELQKMQSNQLRLEIQMREEVERQT
jgi:hypothetical protein